MTIDKAKARLLSWCMAQVGTPEGADNWNKYAVMPELTQLYGGSLQNQPWCDIFSDAAFISCFGLKTGAAMTYQPIGGGSALCRTSARYFQEGGAWTRSPEPGDVVFFYRNGAINHQGIVIRVTGGSVSGISRAFSSQRYPLPQSVARKPSRPLVSGSCQGRAGRRPPASKRKDSIRSSMSGIASGMRTTRPCGP